MKSLNPAEALSVMANSAAQIAENTRPQEDVDKIRREELAQAAVFGSPHKLPKILRELEGRRLLAIQQAEIAAIDTGMHLIGTETLDGQPYSEKPIDFPEGVNVMVPSSVKAYLDKRVKGQEEASRSFAVGLHEMYLRISAAAHREEGAIQVEKNNFLLFGPSGVGKTLMAFSAAEIIKLPFISISATALASVDGQGVDFRDVLRGFCKVDVYGDRNGNRQKKLSLRGAAEYGVLFIDEIDKLKGRLALQHDLLPILEKGHYPLSDGLNFDTADLWVIAAGRFEGLEEIVRNRLGIEEGIPTNELLSYVNERDLIEYGFIPELARRFQTYVPFGALSVEDLKSIMVDIPTSPLYQAVQRFRQRGYKLEVEDEALHLIAQYCVANSEGANGLRIGFSRVLEGLSYQPEVYSDDGRIVLTADYVRGVFHV